MFGDCRVRVRVNPIMNLLRKVRTLLRVIRASGLSELPGVRLDPKWQSALDYLADGLQGNPRPTSSKRILVHGEQP